MSLASFRINQPPSNPYHEWDRARQDIELYEVASERVELEAENDSETNYLWEIISAPLGVTVTIADSTLYKCNFEINVRGPYIARLTVNIGDVDEDIKSFYFSVGSEGGVHALPAMNETNEDNSQSPYTGERGTEIKSNAFRDSVDRHVWMPVKTENATRSLAVNESGYTLLENGSGVVLSLPTAARGLRYAFETDGNDLTIDCQGANEFRGDMVSHFGGTWTSVDLVAGRSRVYASTILDGGDYHWRIYSESGSLFKTGDQTTQWFGSSASPWDYGSGASAIKRTVDLTGLASGDYAVNAGIGGDAGAHYSFVGGLGNTVAADSDHTAIFGTNNTVGVTQASPHSFVAGKDHVVDGYDDRGVLMGWNTVFGDGNTIENVGRSIVAGSSHVVGSALVDPTRYSAVFGHNNSVGVTANSLGALVAGTSHTVDGAYHTVLGASNTVDGQNNFATGFNNEAHGLYSAIFGAYNDLSVTYESPHSIVAGTYNTVDGDAVNELGGNCVGGRDNTVAGDYGAVFGESHMLTGDYCFVAGDTNIVTSDGSIVGGVQNQVLSDRCGVSGYGNLVGYYAVTAPCSVVGGQSNSVEGWVNKGLDCGHNAVFGDGNAVATAYSIVAGSGNVLTNAPDGTTHNAVFGKDNTVGGAATAETSRNVVGGDGNIVDGNAHAVFGGINEIYRGYCNVVGGQYNTVSDIARSLVVGASLTVDSADECIIGGDTTTIGATTATYRSLIVAWQSDVDGKLGQGQGSNLVTGRYQDVDADYSAVVGYDHTVAGDYHVVGGNTNTVNDSSNAVFGWGNILGASNASPYSFVAGESNSIDGDTGPWDHGWNAVFGYDNTVAGGDYNGVFGYQNVLSDPTSGCLVSGRENTVTSFCSVVGGRYNDVSASYDNAVFGFDNEHTGGQSLIAGGYNLTSGDDLAVFGYNNDVGQTNLSPYSIVAGSLNEVNGFAAHGIYEGHNAVFGEYNLVTAEYSIVAGLNNTLGEETSWSAVFGSGHTISGTDNSAGVMVAGYNHTVDGDENAVFGSGHVIDGANNIVGGSAHLVDGANNFVGGNFIDITGNYVLGSGFYHVAVGSYGSVVGAYNEIAADYNVVSGYGAKGRWYGQMAHSAYVADTDYAGRSQNTVNVSASCEAVGLIPAWTQLYPDGEGGSEVLTMERDFSHYYHYMVVARKNGPASGSPETKTWRGLFLAQRDASGSSLVGSTITSDFETSNDDEASWDFRVTVVGNDIVFEGLGSAHASQETNFQLYVYGPEVYGESIVS